MGIDCFGEGLKRINIFFFFFSQSFFFFFFFFIKIPENELEEIPSGVRTALKIRYYR